MPHTRRIPAILAIVALGSSILAALPLPNASASFTLGDQLGIFPYVTSNFDPHVAGPLVFLWPGAGLGAWNGQSAGAPPGYQAPYPNNNPPGLAPDAYQLQSGSYIPSGAILTSSRGDLILALAFNDPAAFGGSIFKYTGMTIYIPPEFDLSNVMANKGLVETTFSSAGNITVTRGAVNDAWGPGFWIINIQGSIQFSSKHRFTEFYYVRINGVTAPAIAGRYFFKVFLWDTKGNFVYPGMALDHVPLTGATSATVPQENYPVVLVKGDANPAILTGTMRYGSFLVSLYGQPLNVAGEVYAVSGTTGAIAADGYFNQASNGAYQVEGLAPGTYDVYAQAAGFPTQEIASGVTVFEGQAFHLDGYLNPGVVITGEVESSNAVGSANWPSTRPIYIELYSSNSYSPSTLVGWSPLNLTTAPYMSYNWNPLLSSPTPLAVAFPSLTGGVPNGVGPSQYWWVDSAGVFTNDGGPSGFDFQFGEKGVFGAPTTFDGHVPQAYATWVGGLTPSRYWVKAYVNGYVQTLGDGVTFNPIYFDVAANEWAGDAFVPMALQISSSIQVTVHFHDQPNTLTDCPINGCIGNSAQGLSQGSRYLIAELRDSSGRLAALNFTFVSGSATAAQIELNGFGVMGPDTNGVKYSDFLYAGIRDYGIPTGSYSVFTYVRGYVEQSPPLQVSIGPGGVTGAVSLRMVRATRFNITVYSVDWEHPSTQRTFEFPRAPLRTFIFNSAGQPVAYVGFPGSLEPAKQPSGFTLLVNEWDGFSAADVKGPDAGVTLLHSTGGGLAPVWNILPNSYGTTGFLIEPSFYRLSDETPSDALSSGIYSLYGMTYGYIQTDTSQMYASLGGFGGTRLTLIRAVNITDTIVFKNEGVLTPTAFNMSMRVRVFDNTGRLVATVSTAMPGQSYYETSTSADTFLVHTLTGTRPLAGNVIPAGTDTVQVNLAGVYDAYGDPLAAFGSNAIRSIGKVDGMWYGIPGYSSTIPSSYTGSYTIEIDTWNDYGASSFYPAVEGLLEGDSFHLLTGVANGFGYTGVTLQANHLGPYAENIPAMASGTHLGGEASIITSMDKEGFYSGAVYAFTFVNSLVTASWVPLQISGNGLHLTVWSFDGRFDGYLPPGSFGVTVHNPQYQPLTTSVTVTGGEANSASTFQLELSSIIAAIPEFPAATVLSLVAGLNVVAITIRRKPRN